MRRRRTRTRQAGQAMTEYLIAVLALMMMMGFCVYEFGGYLGDYYLNVVKVLSLPFP